MSPDEKRLFCQVLKGVKFPDSYAADIRHNVLVNEKKIVNLSTHGNHSSAILSTTCCPESSPSRSKCCAKHVL
jgi:hypothetical protein